jgi:hypothetical protein
LLESSLKGLLPPQEHRLQSGHQLRRRQMLRPPTPPRKRKRIYWSKKMAWEPLLWRMTLKGECRKVVSEEHMR